MVKIMFIILLTFILTSCNDKNKYEPTLKIAVTSWIGYSTLFYIKEKGWLKDTNIEIIKMSSLSEVAMIYKTKNVDIFGGTQYEYMLNKENVKSLKTIMLLDKSTGGDMVLSNKTIKELKSSETIDTYLEVDSVNTIVFNDFVSHYKLKKHNFSFHNTNQTTIKYLLNNTKKDILIVTYIPYDIALKKNGFKELLSTKNNINLLVIDGLFASSKTIRKFRNQIKKLNELINIAIEESKINPKEYYETVHAYNECKTYDEFVDELSKIEWINKRKDNILKNRLNVYGIDLGDQI